MSRAIFVLHFVVGVIGILLASLALVESTRSVRLATHRRFGLALSAVAATAGAHYIVAGLSQAGRARAATGPQLAALVLLLGPVAVFFWLRAEAYLDGPGDRFFDGKPAWISLLPSAVACGAGAVLVTAWMNPPQPASGSGVAALRWLGVLPTILLVVISLAISSSLVRGQQSRRAVLGGWSLSGLAVTMIFPTSAVAYATQILTVRPTLLSSAVDWVGVPAAVWFWRECRSLTGSVERSALRDRVTVPAQRSKRPAPWAATDPQ